MTVYDLIYLIAFSIRACLLGQTACQRYPCACCRLLTASLFKACVWWRNAAAQKTFEVYQRGAGSERCTLWDVLVPKPEINPRNFSR